MIASTAMSGLLTPVQWLWAFSVSAQVAVFALLFRGGNYRKLPLFTTYVALNLCQAAFLVLVYSRFGLSSPAATTIGWASEAATLLAQALATTEVLGWVLRPYRGIWGLSWRLLAVVSIVVVAYAVLDTRGNMGWAIVVADRGYHLTYAIAVIAGLVLTRYYAVPVPAAYKWLLGGFCFYSCSVIVINTFVKEIWHPHDTSLEAIWETISILSFTLVQVFWAVVLRKPLPAVERNPVLLPAYVYGRISPEINQRLRLINEKLIRLWKLEEPPE